MDLLIETHIQRSYTSQTKTKTRNHNLQNEKFAKNFLCIPCFKEIRNTEHGVPNCVIYNPNCKTIHRQESVLNNTLLKNTVTKAKLLSLQWKCEFHEYSQAWMQFYNRTCSSLAALQLSWQAATRNDDISDQTLPEECLSPLTHCICTLLWKQQQCIHASEQRR